MTDDLTHYMRATARLHSDLTAAQQEIKLLRARDDEWRIREDLAQREIDRLECEAELWIEQEQRVNEAYEEIERLREVIEDLLIGRGPRLVGPRAKAREALAALDGVASTGVRDDPKDEPT